MHTLIRALALACAALLPLGAAAQDYPTKPTRILVPYPPGGASDVTARIIADKLSKKWGKPVFVENKAGVNGIIGTETIALAEPDGSTIGLVASSHVTNHALYKKVPYAMADFVPVTITAQVQLGLVVNPNLPANNVVELIKVLKAQPGKINVATSGRGSNPELWALAFEKMTGTDMQDVPYKGSGAAHPDLLERTDAGDVRRGGGRDAAREGRQAQAAGGGRREALAVPARHADDAGSRACRAT